MRRVFVTALLLVVVFGGLAHAQDFKPIIDNERVTVWDTHSPQQRVTLSLFPSKEPRYSAIEATSPAKPVGEPL
jgi:hypothetical protein